MNMHRIIVEMKFGSHLYGLDTPQSDTDYKMVYMPTLADMLLFKSPSNVVTTTGPKDAKNGPGDVDRELISLPKFMKDAIAGNTYAIDMLHCETPVKSSWQWEQLVEHRRKFYCKNMKAYVGFVKSQAAKYSTKAENLHDILEAKASIDRFFGLAVNRLVSNEIVTLNQIRDRLYIGGSAKFHIDSSGNEFYQVHTKKIQLTNTASYACGILKNLIDSYGKRARAAISEGADWKALSHALRVGYQAKRIYTDGDFGYPLPENWFLRKVKAGEVPFEVVSDEMEQLLILIDLAEKTTTLPDKVDTGFWDNWIWEMYKNTYAISEA